MRAAAAEMGPAMAALNERQREFVTQFVLTGNASQACRAAGYSEKDDYAYSRAAWQLKQRADVRLAIDEESRRYLRVLAPQAVARLARIIGDSESKDSDALRAIDIVLARVDPIISGQMIQVSHEHRHRVQLSAEQITARIKELASRVGVDVARLPSPEVIDVTPVEVAP